MEAGSSIVNIEQTRDLDDVHERWSTPLDERYVNVAVWTSPAGKREVPPLKAFMLTYGLGGASDVSRWINGRRVRRGAPPFALGVFPAHDNTVCWEHSTPTRSLGVYLAPGFLERAAAENDVRVDPGAMPELWDCRSTALRRLGTAVLGAGPVGLQDEMYRDNLTNAYAVHLLAAYDPEAWPQIRQSAKIGPRVRRRIVDYVEAHLTRRITLDEIAAIAGMSRYHFCRLFRHEFGVTFYDYVMGRRIDESIDALRDERRTIAATAAERGFSSQAHYTTAFKKRIGTTPAAYRRSLT